MGDLIDPKKEFLVVRHSFLNGPNLNLEHAVSETLQLQGHLDAAHIKRKVVPCFEGDLVQTDMGQPILMHPHLFQNLYSLSPSAFLKLHSRGLAARLEDTLAMVATYQAKHPDQRVFLCLELKLPTQYDTIRSAVKLLQDYGIKDAYFDSFFSHQLNRLDAVNSMADADYPATYPKSFHLIGNVSMVQFRLGRARYDFITVPSATSFGDPDCDVIYGAVGSVRQLQRVAKDERTLGAYVRFKEGKWLTMLWNSMTNTERLRKAYVLSL